VSKQKQRGRIGKLYPISPEKPSQPEQTRAKASTAASSSLKKSEPVCAPFSLKKTRVLQQLDPPLKKAASKNYHPNFKDFDVDRKQKQLARAVDRMIKRVGDSLVAQVESREFQFFKEKIQAGHKLTMGELKKIKSHWKQEYVRHQLREDQHTSQELQKLDEFLGDQRTLMTRLFWDFEDIKEDYDLAQERIVHQVVQKYREIGLDENGFKQFDFREFNIKDMFAAQGQLCYYCASCLDCKKHPLAKKQTLYKEAMFRKAQEEAYQQQHQDFINSRKV
jgi:hypothetical protein